MRRGRWVIWWRRTFQTRVNDRQAWEGLVGLLLYRVQRTGGLSQRRGDWRVQFPGGLTKSLPPADLRELNARSLVWPDPLPEKS